MSRFCSVKAWLLLFPLNRTSKASEVGGWLQTVFQFRYCFFMYTYKRNTLDSVIMNLCALNLS